MLAPARICGTLRNRQAETVILGRKINALGWTVQVLGHQIGCGEVNRMASPTSVGPVLRISRYSTYTLERPQTAGDSIKLGVEA